MSARTHWQVFRDRCFHDADLGFTLDLSRVRIPDERLASLAPKLETALDEMAALEGGAVANADEERRVGHYWLRAPDLAPDAGTRALIRDTEEKVKTFAAAVHEGSVRPPSAPRFTRFLLVGIGGSTLGPQFIDRVLRQRDAPLRAAFVDNTDPDGFAQVIGELGDDLAATLTLVVSKSGTTPETRNGMVEVGAAYRAAGLEFGQHAVAVTAPDSVLDRVARDETWLCRFPFPVWIGGRTSATAVVGQLPAALAGFDVDAFLRGAAAMDRLTRRRDIESNPAALLARTWHVETGGCGKKDMVILPYRDRLSLLGRYLQQLIMESLGKRHDRSGNLVHQGLTVYGNKGSTDQHALVQQLRDGRADFFATFIDVLADQHPSGVEVDPGVTSSDYLSGLLLGTRHALYESHRDCITITLDSLTAHSLGALIALFERTVGLYATLIDVNAYDQPGVEAGKKAATAVLRLQKRVVAHLGGLDGKASSAEAIASELGVESEVATVFHILERLAAQPGRGVLREDGVRGLEPVYSWAGRRSSC